MYSHRITVIAAVAFASMAVLCAQGSMTSFVANETFGPFAGPFGSNGATGDAGNGVVMTSSVGGYSATIVRVNGTLDNTPPLGVTGTLGSEADLRITPTGVSAFQVNGGVGGTYVGPVAVTNTITTRSAFTPGAGPLSIEFVESFDDTGTPDQTWTNVTIDFGNEVVTHGMFSAGSVPGDGSTNSFTTPVVAGGLDFYTFSLSAGVIPGGYLNLQNRTPAGGSAMDTEMALYDSAGMMVNFGSTTFGSCAANNDDGQVPAAGNLHAMLSFGVSDPLANDSGTTCNIGDTDNGEHGAVLPAGSYTVVVGGFDTVFTQAIGGITAGTETGSYELRMTYYVPEPAAYGVVLAGAMCLLLRRRK